MSLKLVNNCTTQLINDLATAATVMSVVTTQKMPALGASDYVYATLISIGAGFDSYGNPNLFEIVKIVGPLTPGAGQTVTIVRGQDGTVATQFTAGDIVDLRVNRATLLEAPSGAGYLLAANNLSDVVSASTSFTNLQFLSAKVGAVARSARSKASDITSVKDFGATGDGVTDDTAAINAALVAVNAAGGGTLYFPTGVYRTSGAHTLGNFVCVAGEGKSSVITCTHATNDLFTVAGIFCSVHDFRFLSSVTRTGGSYVVFPTNNFTCYNCDFEGAYTAITTSGIIADYYNCSFYNCVLGGIQVTSAIDVSIRSCIWPVPSITPTYGINITGCGDLSLIDLNVISQGIDLLINPGNGQAVASIYALNCFFDTASNGIRIAPSGTGVVQRCEFNNCWFSSHTDSGFLVLGNGLTAVSGLSLVNCQGFANGVDGVRFQTAPSSNIQIIGGQFAQNGNNGISSVVDCAGFTVMGAIVGPCANFSGNVHGGIVLNSAGISNVCIMGNVLTGNGTGPLTDAVTTTSKYIAGNIGYNPTAAAISVGASPFAFANNTGAPLSVFVTGGTVSNVALDGSTVATSTNCVVVVPQGKTLTVTYSSAPTMRYIGD